MCGAFRASTLNKPTLNKSAPKNSTWDKAQQRGAIKPLIALVCLTGLLGLSSAAAVSLGDFRPWKSDKTSEPAPEPQSEPVRDATPRSPAVKAAPAPVSAPEPANMPLEPIQQAIPETKPTPEQADLSTPPEPIAAPDPLDQQEQALMDAIDQARHEGGVDLNLISNLV